MGIFDGMNDASSGQGNSGDWFRAGTYEVEIRRHVFKESLQRGKNVGQQAVIIETTVDKVLATGVDVDGNEVTPNSEGSKAKLMWVLARDRSNNLIPKGKANMSRLKAHFTAILGAEPTEAQMEQLFDDGEEVLAGTRVRVEVKPMQSEGGALFTNYYWELLPTPS